MYSSEPKERLILWNTEPTSNPPSDHYFVWIKDGKFYTLDDQGVQKEYATIEELSAKVNTSDIVDNLTSTDTDKPLSANQGKQLNDDKASLSGADFTGEVSAPLADFENGVSNRSIPRTNDDGLVGLWRFENSVYDPIGDRSFNITGSPTYQEGVYKSAIEFDGDDWLSTDTELFDTSNDYSISFKFQHQEQVNSSPRVINYGGRGWGIFTNGDDYFLITYDENEDASFNTIIESPNEGQWYDIVVEFDSLTETYYVYVDSNLEATRTRTVRIEDNEFRCARGRHSGTEWVGRIDELRFYSKLLDEKTRNVLYRYPSGNVGGLISGNNISGGVPDVDGLNINGNPVVESGSNSDGEWIRWADGTQIVLAGRLNAPLGLGDGTFSSPYRSNAGGFDFPVSFSETPTYYSTGVAGSATESCGFTITGSIGVSGVSGSQLWSSSNSSNMDGVMTIVGRWY